MFGGLKVNTRPRWQYFAESWIKSVYRSPSCVPVTGRHRDGEVVKSIFTAPHTTHTHIQPGRCHGGDSKHSTNQQTAQIVAHTLSGPKHSENTACLSDEEKGKISWGFVFLNYVRCLSLPENIWAKHKGGGMTGKEREKVRSPDKNLSVMMFSVIPQEDSHKNIMFTHFPSLSGACSALASIIGSEAMSPYPFHCVLVCVFISHHWYFLLKKRSTVFSDHLLFAKHYS